MCHFASFSKAVRVEYLPIVVAALVPAAVRAVPATALAKIIVCKKENIWFHYANLRISFENVWENAVSTWNSVKTVVKFFSQAFIEYYFPFRILTFPLFSLDELKMIIMWIQPPILPCWIIWSKQDIMI